MRLNLGRAVVAEREIGMSLQNQTRDKKRVLDLLKLCNGLFKKIDELEKLDNACQYYQLLLD